MNVPNSVHDVFGKYMRGIFLILAISGMYSASLFAADFSGVWEWTACNGIKAKQDCGGLTLLLVQRGKKICGVHLAATPGLGRLDEGDPPSVSGTAAGRDALIAVRSGRSGAVAKAKLVRSDNTIHWQLVEGPDDDYYLPGKAKLMRARSTSDAPFAIDTRKACAESLNQTLQPTSKPDAAVRKH